MTSFILAHSSTLYCVGKNISSHHIQQQSFFWQLLPPGAFCNIGAQKKLLQHLWLL
jgi:hypothetical protein